MPPFTQHYRLRIAIILLVLLLPATAVFTPITIPHAQAGGLNCADNSWSVGSESELNTAITCYNNKTVAGNYTISLATNIDLTASSTPINNNRAGVTLLVEGNGAAVDGEGGVNNLRPFNIASNTTVTMQNIIIQDGFLQDDFIGSNFNGAGIYNSGTLTLNNSFMEFNVTFSGNGGAIYNNGGILTINNSTLADNGVITHNGGAIYNNGGTVTIGNSTLSGSFADNGIGGAIYNASGTVSVNSSTLSENTANSGGGIRNVGTLNLQNSIVANSTGGDCNNTGTVNNNGNNLVEDNSCGFSGGSDPMLGSLNWNGGPTKTHALLPGSPALNTGNTSLTSDQRGMARPQGVADDIGAFEAYNCLPQSWTVNSAELLNEAIACYNGKTVAGTYTINLSNNINLTGSAPTINNTQAGVSLVLDGKSFTVDGQNMGGVRPFTIATNTTATFKSITISGGNANSGGGIFNQGTLTLNNSTVSDNSANSSPGGGGIRNEGSLTLNNSTVSGNSANSSGGGGGIRNENGAVTLNNSTVSGNSANNSFGGGLHNKNGNITINNSTISNNSALTNGSAGGGIYNESGTFTIDNSTISGNSAEYSGGIDVQNGTVTITNSTISGNSAGGINNYIGTLTIDNSTISGNSGVGITNIGDSFNNIYAMLTLNNSTISGNSAELSSGAITNGEGGILFVESSTFSGNSTIDGDAGGIENYGTFIVSNTIIANSSGAPDCYNSGTIDNNGHNNVEDNSCGFTGGVDPMLFPLANYGGPTKTHALSPISPLIDAGNTTLITDQRGISRPQGNADDIGAYEAFPTRTTFLPIILK